MIVEHASLSIARLISDSLHSLPCQVTSEGSLQLNYKGNFIGLLKAIVGILEIVSFDVVVVNIIIAATGERLTHFI